MADDPTYGPSDQVVQNAQRLSDFIDATVAYIAGEEGGIDLLHTAIDTLINPPPVVVKVTITGTPPTTGQVGVAYSFTPATGNGAGTKTFALTGGPLLSGLVFSGTTGAISGTPTAAGSMSNLVITVSDDTGSASTAATNVTIAAATVKVTITGTPPTTGQVGTAYSFTPSVANGSGTKTYALSGGPLLAGLAFNETTGAITGTPTQSGSMPNIVISVTDSTGTASTTPTSVTIAAAAPVLAALSLSNTSLQAGTAYTVNILNATSGTTITGTPPDGMTLNSAARTITGTPTTAGAYTFDLTETGGGASNSPRKTTVSITVATAPTAEAFFGSSSRTWATSDPVFGETTGTTPSPSDPFFGSATQTWATTDPVFGKGA